MAIGEFEKYLDVKCNSLETSNNLEKDIFKNKLEEYSLKYIKLKQEREEYIKKNDKKSLRRIKKEWKKTNKVLDKLILLSTPQIYRRIEIGHIYNTDKEKNNELLKNEKDKIEYFYNKDNKVNSSDFCPKVETNNLNTNVNNNHNINNKEIEDRGE